MKTPLFVLIIFLFSINILHGANNNIVINKKSIESQGNYRLGDILRLSESVGFSTNDGYAYNYSFGALNDYQHQDYAIFIDNHKVGFGFLGNKNINALPINLNSIDSVIIINSPKVYLGNFENNGIIHFFTNKNKKQKFYIYNSAIVGNESQDSGPFRYTKFKSPNVDKIGYDYSGTLGLNYKNHNLLSTFHYRQNIYTDWSIKKRINNLDLTNKWPMLIDYGGSINYNGKIDNMPYSLFLSRVNVDNMFHFFEPAGHEFPMNYVNNLFSFSFNKEIKKTFIINPKIKYENEFVQIYKNFGAVRSYHSLDNLNANIEFNILNNKFLNTIGIGVNHQKLFTTQNNFSIIRLVPKLYIDLHFKSKLLGNINLNEFFNYYDNIFYDNYIFSSLKKYSNGNELNIILSKSKEIRKFNSFDLWEKGYMFSEKNQNIFKKTGQNKKYTADIIGNFHLENTTLITITLFSRYFSDYIFRNQDFKFIEDDFSFYSPNIEYNLADGLVSGIKTNLYWKYSKKIHFRFNYAFQKYYSNDDVFLDIWSQLPENAINYNLTFNPSNTFSVWINIQHRSKTKWQDYKDISGIEFLNTYKDEFKYNYIITNTNRIDLHIRKNLFQNRISANLILRNITNQKIYYYPVGVSFDMSMFLGLEYNFAY